MNARILALGAAVATAVAGRLRWYSDDRTDSVFRPHRSLAEAHPDLAAAVVAVVAVAFVMVLIDLLAGPVPAAAWRYLLGLAGLALVLVIAGIASTPHGMYGALGQFAGVVCALALTVAAAWIVRSRAPAPRVPA